MKIVLFSNDKKLIFDIDSFLPSGVLLIKNFEEICSKLTCLKFNLFIIEYELIKNNKDFLLSLEKAKNNNNKVILIVKNDDEVDHYLNYIDDFWVHPYNYSSLCKKIKILTKNSSISIKSINKIEDILFKELEKQLNLGKFKFKNSEIFIKIEWIIYILKLIYDTEFMIDEKMFDYLILLSKEILNNHGVKSEILISKDFTIEAFDNIKKKNICLIFMCFMRVFTLEKFLKINVKIQNNIIYFITNVTENNLENTVGNNYLYLLNKHISLEVKKDKTIYLIYNLNLD